MTISTEVRKAGPFIGNDSASAFPFAFKVFKAADLIVVRRQDNIGEETTLILDSDYHVTLNGNQDTTPGGVVTLVAGALASGFTLVVSSELPYLQPTDLTNQGGFYPKVITNALDRLTIFCQQLLEITGRTLKLPITAPTNISAEIPLPNPSELIAWNETGTGLTTISPQSLVTSIAYGSATADLFAGDGVTTTFPLTTNPASVNNLDVSVGGFSQRPVQGGIGDYSWNGGASITFVTPPPAPTVPGDKNVLVRYMQAIPVSDSEALHAQTRESLRRSYAEAGYNLVDGSFETGGTLASTTDVLLLESTGAAYAWTGAYPVGGYDVAPGIDPTVVVGFELRKNVALRSELASNSGLSNVGVCPDVATLRSLTGLTVGRKVQLAGYYSDTVGVGGGVLIVTDDATSADNGGTIFVTSDGVRVKRERKLRLKASDFGVVGDWNGTTGTDNRSRIEAMIAASNSSQPWEIDLDNVGVSTIQINSKDGWEGFISGSVVNISAKPAVGSTDEKDSAGGVLPTFKITNCNKWKLKGGAVDNRYREAFWVENCNKFVNECDVLGSGLNNNLRPNYYRYCSSFKLKNFRHEATSEKPATGYYAHCNNINLWDCSNFKILDFEVEDTGSNGVYIGSNCKDFTIAQYVISGNAMSGIQLAWSAFGRFPYRGTIGAGMINGNRADAIDINNTSGSVVRIQLVIEGVQSVNNGYNYDGTVTVDGSGLGTFKNVSHFDVIGCHSEDSARAGFYAYNCNNFNIVGGSIKKEKTTNNAGEGVYIERCSDWSVAGIDVAMASGQEALKLYGTLANGVIGKNTKLKGIIALPTPDGTTTYTNVCFDGAIISTTAEVQGRVPFKNTKITSSANGLVAYENVDNCDIESTAGIGLRYGSSGVSVSGGRYKGTNSGTYCGVHRCALSRAKVIGGSGPASYWVSSVASQIINNQFTAGTGNALLTDSACTKTVSFGNYSTGVDSKGGTYDINY